MTDLLEANERREAEHGKPVLKKRVETMQIGVDSFAAALPDDGKGVVVSTSDSIRNLVERIFDVNVLGLILATQEAVKLFGPSGGSVINISSVASTSAMPGGSVYGATKAAVDAVTRTFAKELGAKKIRVNAINPGMIETEGLRSAGIAESDFRKQYEAQASLGRIGQPQDIAAAAVFLASPDSAWITGETFYVTCGYR